MFHRFIPNPVIAQALAVHLLFEEQADAYREAAGLLAGAHGRRLVDGIVDALSATFDIEPRTFSKLRDLLAILELERVDMFGGSEVAKFCEIASDDPVMEEICLLTDQLRSAMNLAQPD